MGEEGRSAHRTFRLLSQELAIAGFLAVRFDYDGTGDSAGLLTEPDRVAAWSASVIAAVELLHSCGVSRVDGVGMRLGATIAAAATSSVHGGGTEGDANFPAVSPPFGSLVLWDPCGNGRDFLREGRALHSLGEEVDDAVTGGDVDTPGFRFTADTVAQMQSLDIAALPDDIPLAWRTLVLVRDDRQLKKKIKKRLLAEPEIDWGVAIGQQAMIDVSPSSSLPPRESIREIVRWLSDAGDLPGPASVAVPPGDRQVTLTVAAYDTGDTNTEVAPTAGPQCAAAIQVVEQARPFGPRLLRGVVTEPVTDAAGRPWVVLLNVAVEHYIGPGRLWVQLARQWAALGFRCVRLDQSGVGDSPTRPGQADDVIFATEWISELPEVVDELRASGSPVVLVGLCSGAYSALEAALHTRVDAIVAVNPRLRILETSKGMPLFDPHRRAARPPLRPLARLALRREYLAGGLWRIYRQFAIWQAPMAVLFAVARRGTDIRMIAGPRDSRGYREVVAWSVARALKGRWTKRVHFDRVDTLDHSLLSQYCQALFRNVATDYLLERYGAQRPSLPDR